MTKAETQEALLEFPRRSPGPGGRPSATEPGDESRNRGRSDLVQLVLEGGLPVAYRFLDDTIERRGNQAHEIACQLHAKGASDGEALEHKGKLTSALEAEIAALLQTSIDRARLERLQGAVGETKGPRGMPRGAALRGAEQKLVEAERELVLAGDSGRTPRRSGLLLMAILLAALFSAVLSPSVPLLVTALREVPGTLVGLEKTRVDRALSGWG